jgi:hypothetical protein
MHRNVARIRILTLLLAVLFLSGQFHLCTDLSAGPVSSHTCPLCNTAASAIAPQTLLLAIMPLSNRLELRLSNSERWTDLPRAISPRAPPSGSLYF